MESEHSPGDIVSSEGVGVLQEILLPLHQPESVTDKTIFGPLVAQLAPSMTSAGAGAAAAGEAVEELEQNKFKTNPFSPFSLRTSCDLIQLS